LIFLRDKKINKIMKRISQKWIDKLNENEIFVFGSNLDGWHGTFLD
jgi:hypothetical protein